MKKLIFLLLLTISTTACADTIQRYRNLPSCVFAESLDDYNRLETLYSFNGAPLLKTVGGRNAMWFDGTDDWITLDGNMFPRVVEDTTGTIAMWIRADTDDGALNALFSISSDTAGDRTVLGMTVNMSPNALTTYCRIDDTLQWLAVGATSSIEVDVWYHVALVQNGTSPQYYVDGVASTTTMSDNTDPTQWIAGLFDAVKPPDACNIGIWEGTTNNYYPWDGYIKDVLVFNRALSATEILSIYNGTAFDYDKDLVSKWDMDSINPPDTGWKGNGNDGTGVSLVTASVVDGHDGGQAIHMDGGADFIQVDGLVTELAGYTTGTLSSWVRMPLDSGGWETIFAIGSDDAATTEQSLYYENDADDRIGASCVTDDTVHWSVRSDVDFLDNYIGEWVHVVLTHNGTQPALYFQGTLPTQNWIVDSDRTKWWGDTISATDPVDTANIGVLEQNGTDYYRWPGDIDDVSIYSSGLTQLQVEDLYVQTR